VRVRNVVVAAVLALPVHAHDVEHEVASPNGSASTSTTVVRSKRLDRPVGETVIETPAAAAPVAGGGTASDLLRRAPGVFISQHSGQGKAHQIFLRGFDAEHGQDVELSVDGVPQNDTSHIHGQGYADLTLLPPELVQRFVLRPGSYDVRQGDFAVAGSIDFVTGAPAAGLVLRSSVGEYGLLRTFASLAPASSSGDLRTYAGVEAATGEGFGVRRAFSRASAWGQGVVSVSDDDEVVFAAMVGHGEFESPGVLRQADIDSGLVDDRFATYDDQQGGSNTRAQASLTTLLHEGGFDIDARAWTAWHQLLLVQNFTGALVNPEGDRTQQDNAAVIGGADLELRRRVQLWTLPLRLAVGTKNRVDHIRQRQVRLDTTTNGETIVDVDTELDVAHTGVYGEVGVTPLPGVVVRGGVRYEHLLVRLVGDDSTSSDDDSVATGSTLAPRVVVGWRAVDAGRTTLQVTAAAGEGFRTPQARSLGDLEVAQLTRVRGSDIGAQLTVGNGLDVSSTLFGVYVESDRVFDHATARNVFLGPTLRVGNTSRVAVAVDRLTPGLSLASSWTFVHARLRDSSSTNAAFYGSTVPYAPTVVGRFEAVWQRTIGVQGHDVRCRVELDPWLVGPRPMPLSQTSPEFFAVDGSLSLGLGALSWSIEGSNLLNANVVDGAFMYASDFTAFGGTGSALPALHVTAGAPRYLSTSLSVGF
jgi:iron complex outermembrane receptor protein